MKLGIILFVTICLTLVIINSVKATNISVNGTLKVYATWDTSINSEKFDDNSFASYPYLEAYNITNYTVSSCPWYAFWCHPASNATNATYYGQSEAILQFNLQDYKAIRQNNGSILYPTHIDVYGGNASIGGGYLYLYDYGYGKQNEGMPLIPINITRINSNNWNGDNMTWISNIWNDTSYTAGQTSIEFGWDMSDPSNPPTPLHMIPISFNSTFTQNGYYTFRITHWNITRSDNTKDNGWLKFYSNEGPSDKVPVLIINYTGYLDTNVPINITPVNWTGWTPSNWTAGWIPGAMQSFRLSTQTSALTKNLTVLFVAFFAGGFVARKRNGFFWASIVFMAVLLMAATFGMFNWYVLIMMGFIIVTVGILKKSHVEYGDYPPEEMA